MRRLICTVMIGILILSFCACNADSYDETIATEFSTAPTDASEPILPPVTETSPPVSPSGQILLTVSKIVFSVVGESEDIYIGTAERENVTWYSADENVAVFQNGILTATGVGTTTVSASFNGQYFECEVHCLANTEEELANISEDVLRSAKRYPVVLTNPPTDYFSDVVLVGDSITYILFQYQTIHKRLGTPAFLSRGGSSYNGFVLRYYNMYYQGNEMFLEDAIAQVGATKVFIMLGQNDLGYRTIEETISSIDILVSRIRETLPGADIYFQSCVYEWYVTGADNSKNEKIDDFNRALEVFCVENNCHYVNINHYTSDHTNMMPTEYSMDQGIHLNEAGCIAWMDALNLYAYEQMIKGEIS